MATNAHSKAGAGGAPDDFLTIDEAANVLRISTTTMRRRIRSGAVTAYRRRGRRLWVKRCDLDELAEPVDAPSPDRPGNELTAAEVAQWLAAFDQSRQRHAEQLAKRHGVPYPDSALDIAAARAERSAVRQ
ncbi:MAG: helix-turn-helix domain-containing protein [Dehalococcoidia bacterium]